METGWNTGFLTLAKVEVYICIEEKKQRRGMLRDKLSLKYPLVWIKQYTFIVTESSDYSVGNMVNNIVITVHDTR